MADEFVDSTKIERIALSGENRWIVVKRELNAGEQRRLFARMMRDMTPGEKVTINPEQVGITKVLAYLLDWSFKDQHGYTVPVSESALNNLRPSTFAEIAKAIEDHEAQYEATREQEKNGQAGESASNSISRSPDTISGVTNGSTNSIQMSTTSS